jgi:ubiquinone/menaquinone biosynthesis C-methylase UbiE
MVEPLDGFDPQETYDTAADDYERASRDFWGYVSMRSVERLDLRRGDRVLDVPCGTGTAVVAAAQAVGPGGRVVGIDFAPRMVAIAEGRAAASGLANIEVIVGDMREIAPPAVAFDAIACSLGVFFVNDMPALVRSLVALARPGTGRLAVSVFGEKFFEPLRSVFVAAVGAVAPQIEVAQPWCRTEREATLRVLFEGADVAEVSVTTDEDRVQVRDSSDWWRIVNGSGLRHTLDLLGDSAAAEVRARCESDLSARGIDELVTTSRYALARRAR